MATKSFIKTIGSKGLLADYNTSGKKLQTELTAGDNITIDGNTISSDQLFVAKYGTTKYAEIKAAYAAGKICTVLYASRYFYVVRIDSSHILFASSNGTEEMYSVSVGSGNTWSFRSDKLQSRLTFDTTPTAGSNNPVTSDGINSALDSKANAGNFVAVRGAKGFMVKFPKGLNLFDGVFINILNGYGGKAYRNITFAIRKEGTAAPQVYRYNTDVSADTHPDGKNFSVYYGAYPSDPNTNIILIVPSKNITGIVHLSWGDSRASWNILYDTPNTTDLSSITPIEHNNVFGANKGSASVPVYVDANGEATPCTDNFVHDSDLDSRVPAPTSTTGTQVLKCINGVIQWVTE